MNGKRVLDIQYTENIRRPRRKRNALRFSYKSPNFVLAENRDRTRCYYTCLFLLVYPKPFGQGRQQRIFAGVFFKSKKRY